jgi:hypothetical protein
MGEQRVFSGSDLSAILTTLLFAFPLIAIDRQLTLRAAANLHSFIN